MDNSLAIKIEEEKQATKLEFAETKVGLISGNEGLAMGVGFDHGYRFACKTIIDYLDSRTPDILILRTVIRDIKEHFVRNS